MTSRPESEPTEVAVAVVGGGAAGVGAARAAAAALGADGGRVVLIGDRRPGGGARLAADGGALLECAVRGLDWHAALAHLRTVRAAVEDRCRAAALRADGVDLVTGRARQHGGGRIAVEAAAGASPHTPPLVRARRIVLATGDEDRLPAVSGLADVRPLTGTTLLGLASLPETMVVLGGGPHGCELAQALARFGVHVTLIEGTDRLLPGEHPDASALVTKALREDGVRVFTGAPALKVAPTLDGGVWVGTGVGGDVAAEALLLATGRRPAVQALDPAAAGVRLTAQGWVGVDDRLVTSAPDVLAVGRVTGLLPHGTSDPVMARVAGTNAVARRRARSRWSASALPRVVRTEPPVASVGASPGTAGDAARVGDLPYRGIERGLGGDRPGGLIRLVAGPARTARWGRGGAGSALLGAGVVGAQAGEIVGLVALALAAGMSVEHLARVPLSSRTWGAALQQAAAEFGVVGAAPAGAGGGTVVSTP